MKQVYRGHEIEVWRDQSLAGYTLLYYSVFRLSDGLECTSGFEDSTETVREKMKQFRERIDAELSEACFAEFLGHSSVVSLMIVKRTPEEYVVDIGYWVGEAVERAATWLGHLLRRLSHTPEAIPCHINGARVIFEGEVAFGNDDILEQNVTFGPEGIVEARPVLWRRRGRGKSETSGGSLAGLWTSAGQPVSPIVQSSGMDYARQKESDNL